MDKVNISEIALECVNKFSFFATYEMCRSGAQPGRLPELEVAGRYFKFVPLLALRGLFLVTREIFTQLV